MKNFWEAAFAAVKREYLAAAHDWSPDDHPLKHSHVVRRDVNGLPLEFVNVMSAQLQDGSVGTKTIRVNEDTGDMSGIVALSRPDGSALALDAGPLTRVRCALMAMVAMDRFGETQPDIRVGFIGTGRTNLSTAMAMNAVWGIEEFVLRGSPRNPSKNMERFPGRVMVDHSANFYLLNSCDVVISCTNGSGNPDELISRSQLPAPRLFIAQDLGYILGESFRHGLPSYCDYPAQLEPHHLDEFPYDHHQATLLNLETATPQNLPAAVYLYGVAVADVALAQVMCHQEAPAEVT